jgi:hypothetical protein
MNTNVNDIETDTNELQTDLTNGGRLDLLIDAILADTGELQTDWANGGRLDLLIDAILADTGELQTDWVDGGRLDLLIDAILTDTAVIGAAGAGLTAIPWNAAWDAEVESEVDDALGGGTGTALTGIPWNAAWDAQVQSEVNDALVALGLDHLLSASVTGTDVTDNSIIAKLVSKEAIADWDDFVNTTDSLQAIRDLIGTAGAGLTAVPWNAAWDAEVQSEVDDALTAHAITGTDGKALISTDAQAAVYAAIADKFLGRNIAGGSDGTRDVTSALRALRNKWTIAGGTLTVREEDDSTSAWTAAVTTAAGDPITEVDPA